MKIIKSAALLFVLILLFSFSVFNIHPVKVRFFTWQSPELPLFLILVFVFALGCVAAALWGALRCAGRGRATKKGLPPKGEAKGEEKRKTMKGQEDKAPENPEDSQR